MPIRPECDSQNPEPEKSAEHLEFEAKELLRLHRLDSLLKFACLWAELANVTATKDFGNVSAFGKLDVGGEEVSVPVSYLIWMEKQLDDMAPHLIWMEKQLDDMKKLLRMRFGPVPARPGRARHG